MSSKRSRRTALASARAAVATLVVVVLFAAPVTALAAGTVSRADIGANIFDDGSLVVTDERTFALTPEITFVAWEIPTYGVEDMEVLGFEGPGGVYRRNQVGSDGGRPEWRTYYVEVTEDYLLIYGWFRPREGRATFTAWYRVPDAVTEWQGSAGIYNRLAASTQAEGVRGVRLVFSEQVTVPQESRTNELLARVQPWLEEPPEVVERFSVWFALIVALFVLITLLLVVWRRRRWYATSFVGSAIPTVPHGLSPALAGVLLSGRTGYRVGLAATAIDLADRGLVSVDKGEGAFGRLRLSIDRSQALALERHEQVVRRVLFFWLGWLGSYTVPVTRRAVDRSKASAVAVVGAIAFGAALRAQLQEYRLASRYTPGRVVLVCAMGVLVVASGVPALFISGVIPVFVLNCLIGIAVPFVWLVPLRLTDAGVEQRNLYGSFRACLADQACGEGLTGFSPADWRRAFALAVAFGLADTLPPAAAAHAEPSAPAADSLAAVAVALAPTKRR